MLEVVESINKNRPGIIPLSKIQDKTALYQENIGAANFLQSQVQPSEETNLRALLELIQKVGPSQVQKLLDNQTPFRDDDEWNQNFD